MSFLETKIGVGIVVGVGVMIATTCVNQGGRIISNKIGENAWDPEVDMAIKQQVQPVKDVVTTLTRSTQSLAISRMESERAQKEALKTGKLGVAAEVAQTKPEFRSRDQQMLYTEMVQDAQKLDQEIVAIEDEIIKQKEIQQLPVFTELEQSTEHGDTQ